MDPLHASPPSADQSPQGLQSHMQAAFYPPKPFEVLDSCHREILGMLGDLGRLIEHVKLHGVDATARELARGMHLFFSTTALPHHLDEERHVFPRLLETGAPSVAEMVDKLRRDHVEIEAQWRTIVPHLDMIARGYSHPRLDELQTLSDRFCALCSKHIQQEEQWIYPEAKAHLDREDLWVMRRDMAERRKGLNPAPIEIDLDTDTDDVRPS